MEVDKGNKWGKVAIVGMGYVGLPLSLAIVQAGYEVIGIDLNKAWLDKLREGRFYMPSLSKSELQEALKKGQLLLSDEYSSISACNKVVICVPTPLTLAREPDLSYIIQGVEGMLSYINKQTLVSLESTTYPGTTEELIVARIEKEKGWKVGEDFYVCYSPERVDPGNSVFVVGNTPKVIGGATNKCLALGKAFYETFIPNVKQVKSTQVAEMSKLLENTFRCINIAFINEMTMLCERMHIDIWEVIEAAATKPFGFMKFSPGPGVGGHCIPLDPLYLAWEASKYQYSSRFIELATDINNYMPYYVVEHIIRILYARGAKTARILLVGMSYKEGSADLRESPSLQIYKLLEKEKMEIAFFDPYIEKLEIEGKCLTRTPLEEKYLETFDLIVILVNHQAVDYKKIEQYGACIYDTKNACSEIESSKIIKLGECITPFRDTKE